MKAFCIVFLVFLILPLPVMGEEKISVIRTGGEQFLNDVETKEYKKFLNEMRKTDTKRVFVDYKEDRDTRYRKLRESAYFEAREAEMLSQRLWEQRYADRWDRQSQLIDKVFSGDSYESDRAAKALMFGYPASKGTRKRY
ncbi:MAG TPA: hypothetical protein PLW88_00730 [Syntrophorhabdaceae bacterium]|nr:hypothetical protein [Syntrophorhabdaceae bacterium]HPP05863.1 hypothetical protein [Syntrophorhabdaceae bacterium]